MSGREVVVEAVRTPIGDAHAAKLLAATLTELVSRTGIDPIDVDDLLAGCVMMYGEQSYDIARTAWLLADLPEQVPATTMDRQSGSAQQAFNFGADTSWTSTRRTKLLCAQMGSR